MAAVSILPLMLLGSIGTSAAAEEDPAAPPADQGAQPDDGSGAAAPSGGAEGAGVPGTSDGSEAPAGDTAAAPAPFIGFDLKGGYVAAGVGLRNRGFGTINLTGIPAGASVTKAYLFWSVINSSETANLKSGKFRNVAITGTKVGQGPTPCWSQASTGFAYRADVTSLVSGNGAYALTGFASGQTNGADPFTSGSLAPLAEGASLVVVYSKATYPQTVIKINNGYHLTMSAASGATLSIPFGFSATNPVGPVQTTFIGADGQTASEPPSKFNGTALGLADWDGTDPPLPRYSNGNLWDTDTLNPVNLVRPGHTSASIRVEGGPDCLVWVAQVLSIGKFGAADTDGDKLLDGWEANGYDADNNGVIDVALPFLGASPVHKDLYVEMDYMGAEGACPCHLPLVGDLNRIVNAYAAAPFANNPDGLPGIRAHLDAGAARGAAFNLGGGNNVAHDVDLNPVVSQFNAIKSANFNSKRAKIFYYMIWAHNYNGGTSSGNAFAIPNDSFVVTLGGWTSHGTSDVKVGTFIHEFGHDLGLGHGGNSGTNYKPNYLSVMSYAFQVTGIPTTSGGALFSYSNAALPSLNENSLNEATGLASAAASPFKTRWFCPSGAQAQTPGTANGPIDWNCNGTKAGTVAVDINKDGAKNTLTGWNDWASLVFGGGTVGPGAGGAEPTAAPAPEQELTFEEHQRHTNNGRNPQNR